MANVIRLDGDLAQHNISLLTQAPEELPSQQVIALVDGNSTEEAATAFTDHLKERAGQLGSEVEKIRAFVAKHADDLRSAVEALQERDSLNATQAGDALSLIDAAATTPPLTGSSNGATSGAAGVRSALSGGPQ